MLKYSVKIMKSSWKIYLFVAVQLTLILLTSIFMTSSIYSRVEYYLPFKEIMNSSASAVSFTGSYVDKGDLNSILLDCKTSPIMDDIPTIHQLYIRYVPLIDNSDRTLEVKGYDDPIISMFTPVLQSGKWLDENAFLTDDGCIPAVIFQNQYNYLLGDTFAGTAKTYENEDINVNFKVVGILKDDSRIFGAVSTPLNNHLSFYETPKQHYAPELDANQPLLMAIVPNKIINDLNVVSRYDFVNGIVTYLNGTDAKDTALNTSKLLLKYGNSAENIWNIKENSINYIKIQLFTLLPIVICIAIIVFVSGVCTTAIITKRNLKKYVVLYICGMRWKQCWKICAVNSITISLISYISALFISEIIYLAFDINMNISIYSLPVCIILIVIFVVLSLIIPFNLIKSSQPKDLLRKA